MLAVICWACPDLAGAADTWFVPPDEEIGGRSQAEWSQSWWQWAVSFSRSGSPVADPTGERCHLKQQGPVWFLAGTYGTARTVRICTVPRDKYVFFPLVNFVVMPGGAASTCSSRMRAARSLADGPERLIVDLDGQRLVDLLGHRQATDTCFDVGASSEPRQRIYPSAADGYYVMLRPLPSGRHELNFGGVLPRISQAVTYTLIVE